MQGKTIAKFCLLAVLLVTSGRAAEATSKDSDIETNRPSFTDSAIVVPKGSLQLENGTLYQWFNHAQDEFDIPETQVRLGFLERTEFQMFVPNYVLRRSPGGTNGGVTSLSEVGLKHQIGPIKALQLSFEGSIDIPTGRTLLSGTGVQPVFRLPFALPIGKNYQLCGMPSFLLLNSGRDASYQQTVMLCRGLGRKATVFAEYAGFFTHEQPPVNIAHFGGTYKLNSNNQIDIRFGFGLNRDAPTAFLGGGYSFRVDRLWPFK